MGEAAHFTALRDTAQEELTAAIADHDQKETDHTHALGAKSVATDHLNEFTEEHNIAVAAHGKAVTKKDGEYSVPLTVFVPNADIATICADANPGNSCGERTCLVEANFLSITISPVYAGDVYWVNMWNDASMNHAGTFDFETECKVPGNTNFGCGPSGCGSGSPPVVLPKQCCGPYPSRMDFNPSRNMCCTDFVEPLGTC